MGFCFTSALPGFINIATKAFETVSLAGRLPNGASGVKNKSRQAPHIYPRMNRIPLPKSKRSSSLLVALGSNFPIIKAKIQSSADIMGRINRNAGDPLLETFDHGFVFEGPTNLRNVGERTSCF